MFLFRIYYGIIFLCNRIGSSRVVGSSPKERGWDSWCQYEAITLAFNAGVYTVTFIGVIIALLTLLTKKK
jgi:hypothetical protein